jgi:hypothetical protein
LKVGDVLVCYQKPRGRFKPGVTSNMAPSGSNSQ